MENDVGIGYRLSFNELIYLAAGTNVNEIYGLKHSPKKLSEEEMIEEWESVKISLNKKEYVKLEGDKAVVDGALFELIEIISKPRLFYVCQSKDELSGYSCNYYIRNNIAVRLEYEASLKDIYTLTRYDDMQLLKSSMQNFFRISTQKFEKANEKVVLGLDELNHFIESIVNNDEAEQVNILKRKGVEEKYISDIIDALGSKKCFRTMLVISFNQTSNNVVKEYIIYGGEKYLWQIEMRNKSATILSIDDGVMMNKIEIMSEVLYYV